METTTDRFRVIPYDGGVVGDYKYCDTREEGFALIAERGSGWLQKSIHPDPKDVNGGYWKTILSERQRLEEEIASHAIEFKRTPSEIVELITAVTGVVIDSDDPGLNVCSLLTEEQLKAVVDSCRQNEEPGSHNDDQRSWDYDLDVINEATAEAARFQGEYWDGLRDLEESIGFYIDSPDEFVDVTFVSIAHAREHYRHWEEKSRPNTFASDHAKPE